jgi:RimJ/RimL family protein N-acetyltransferase
MTRFFSGVRAGFTPEKFDLLFAVRIAHQLAGIQALHATDFGVTRTAETGSWLGRSYQRRGIGTRMRRAVCAFAFDHLGAVELTSGAFLDNPASLAVSSKVGYRPNGRFRMTRREGEVAINQRLVLTPDAFVRGEPITVTGAEQLRSFLELG